MKKYLLSMVLVLAASIGARAQLSFGLKGGVNFSKIYTDNLKESSVTGYEAGLFARFGGNIYLQPEAYFGSSGGKFEFNTNNNTATTNGKVTFNTLNIPLLLGRRFGSGSLNFRLMAGPVYTSILNKNQSFDDNVNNAYRDFGHYRNSTLGFQAGAGFDVGALTADFRYEGGLTRINPAYGQRQNLFALSIGFKIL